MPPRQRLPFFEPLLWFAALRLAQRLQDAFVVREHRRRERRSVTAAAAVVGAAAVGASGDGEIKGEIKGESKDESKAKKGDVDLRSLDTLQ